MTRRRPLADVVPLVANPGRRPAGDPGGNRAAARVAVTVAMTVAATVTMTVAATVAMTVAATVAIAPPAMAGPRTTAAPAASVSLDRLARAWVHDYRVEGRHSMPAWVEEVRLTRTGSDFVLEGGAPAGYAQARSHVAARHDGTIEWRSGGSGTPSGFLTSATLLATGRAGRLRGVSAVPRPFGVRQVVCVDARRLGIRAPVLDPCADTVTGAVIALRHRTTGRFDGPSLDPYSVRIELVPPSRTHRTTPPPAAQHPRKDHP